jgi:hypothetical protein
VERRPLAAVRRRDRRGLRADRRPGRPGADLGRAGLGLPGRADAGGAGQARVERTSGNAEIALDTTDLGAAYLGTFTIGELLRAGRAEELRAGAATQADAMFRTERAPWSPLVF